VVGNINRDLKTAPFSPGNSLFEDGETSLSGLSETIGGGGANSAAMAAALGAKVWLLGQVGGDPLGVRLAETLGRHGVDCRLHRAPLLATGTSVNLVYDTGQRHFLSWHPNNAALAPENLDLTILPEAQHLLRADIWFSEAMLFGGNQRLLTAARDAGVSTSIDLNWDPQWGRAPAGEIARRKGAVREVLPLLDLVHGNVTELKEFTGEGDLSAAVGRLLNWGAGAVVVHMGSQGAGWFSRTECIIEPAVPVQRPVVATGTGDLLSVCLMLLHHRADVPLLDRLRLANRLVSEFMEGKRELIPRL
jgi:sugar/nucleoside kinase (ribokinase family)